MNIHRTETASDPRATGARRRARAVWLAPAALALALLSGCQIGTGDVELSMAPEEIDYSNFMSEFREYFQVLAKDTETGATVSGFPVEISMDMAGNGCAGVGMGQYWTLEDENKNPVPCPWSAVTGDGGTLRFFLHFYGAEGRECAAWAYTVQAFGEGGGAAIAVGKNTCPEEEAGEE